MGMGVALVLGCVILEGTGPPCTELCVLGGRVREPWGHCNHSWSRGPSRPNTGLAVLGRPPEFVRVDPHGVPCLDTECFCPAVGLLYLRPLSDVHTDNDYRASPVSVGPE